MSDIQPYFGGGMASWQPGRRGVRAISRNTMAAQIRVSDADAETDVAVAKVENLTMATSTAMSSVVRIAQAQRHLEQLAPEASARLAYLADDHMLGMGEVLADLRRDMRRR